MAGTNVVNLMAFSSMLSPVSLIKRCWRKNADIFIQNGAKKTVYMQATNSNMPLSNKAKHLSKTVWDMKILKPFLEEFKSTRTASSLTVSVKDMGYFIIAATDFKDLTVTNGDLNVALITSSLGKVVIALRCGKDEKCPFVKRREAGERLKLLINQILCSDYDSFVGFVLYKKLEQIVDVWDGEKQDNMYFDWFVEIFLNNRGVNEVSDILISHTKDFEHENIEVYCGNYQDTDCVPENIKKPDNSVVNVIG